MLTEKTYHVVFILSSPRMPTLGNISQVSTHYDCEGNLLLEGGGKQILNGQTLQKEKQDIKVCIHYPDEAAPW